MQGAILIADDNDSIRRVLRNAFEKENYRICAEAENGAIAIAKIKEFDPDLVLLDFSMPVLNGLEVLRVLKREHPTTPVILFTMFKDRYLESEAFAAGASVVLSKAAGLDTVIEQARVLLRYSRHPRSASDGAWAAHLPT